MVKRIHFTKCFEYFYSTEIVAVAILSNTRVFALVLGLMERVLSAKRALGSVSRGRAGLYPVTEQHPVLIHPGDHRTPPARTGEPFLLLLRRLLPLFPPSSGQNCSLHFVATLSCF